MPHLARVSALYRYPMKGLSPEPLATANLVEGAHFPGDRLYAIENGPSGFDPSAPAHMPKIKFLMLMRHERLALLETRYDDATGHLTIETSDGGCVTGDLGSSEGRAALEKFFAEAFVYELRGPPRILAAAGHRFVDSRQGFVSIINLNSLRDIERLSGRPVDPLRFRANVYVEGWPAWSEFDLVGLRLRIGQAVVEITKRIDRCAATDVDPRTGRRDFTMVPLLEESFGHHDCGIYARVIDSGRIAQHDAVTLMP